MEITAAAALVLEDIIDEGRTDVAEREQRDESGRQEPGTFPPRMLSDSACVCVCSEFTGDGEGVDGGDCESAANVNGETIRRGPRQ